MAESKFHVGDLQGEIESLSDQIATQAFDSAAASLDNVKSKLLALAQTMNAGEMKNIWLIYSGQNESVFTNGNYYCGWLAINSKGSNWLYFSGIIKGLCGNDTIEYTYSNGSWGFNKLAIA